jgi:hypothetical protein
MKSNDKKQQEIKNKQKSMSAKQTHRPLGQLRLLSLLCEREKFSSAFFRFPIQKSGLKIEPSAKMVLVVAN